MNNYEFSSADIDVYEAEIERLKAKILKLTNALESIYLNSDKGTPEFETAREFFE